MWCLPSDSMFQPAIYVTSLAAVELLRAREGGQQIIDSVDVTCGLSLGEYTALAFAGSFRWVTEVNYYFIKNLHKIKALWMVIVACLPVHFWAWNLCALKKTLLWVWQWMVCVSDPTMGFLNVNNWLEVCCLLRMSSVSCNEIVCSIWEKYMRKWILSNPCSFEHESCD